MRGDIFASFGSEAVEELRRAAGEVQAVGDDVRRLATTVLALGSVAWESSAAGSFRRRVADESGRVRVAASLADEAALALWRHARAVDRAVEEVAGEVGELGAIARGMRWLG